MPWLVWLIWLGIVSQSKMSQAGFPAMEHAWVVGSGPGHGTYER